jgi:hypothetical protein
MGSLRPSRSDAEIRHGSFSHCLVVGRAKSHEAGRNVEVMWLVELVSSHTIAGCRKQNGPPLTEAAMAAPIVGENSIGMRLAWRSFQAAIRRSASSSTFGLSDSKFSISCNRLGRRRLFQQHRPISDVDQLSIL